MLGCILVLHIVFTGYFNSITACIVRAYVTGHGSPIFCEFYASKIYGQAFHEHAFGKVCSGDVAIIKSKGGRGITSP